MTDRQIIEELIHEKGELKDLAYRMMDTDFFGDRKVRIMSRNAKLLYTYIVLGKDGNISGCFEMCLQVAAFDLGLTMEEAKDAIEEIIKIGCIDYDYETEEVLVKNFCKYNWSKSQLTIKGIKRGIEKIHNKSFKAFVIEKLKNLEGETDEEPEKEEDPEPEEPKSEPKEKEKRHHRGTFAKKVMLSDSEMQKLSDRMGETKRDEMIDVLDRYIATHNVRYSNHYLVIINWYEKDHRKEKKPAAGSLKEQLASRRRA